ncbi:MAG TPA: sulfatase [Thermoanaerobaculia bacterium]|jgi:arylsulfatase|nr:sulfatase [Thermoanaerobaculia bacterium]
MRAKTVLALLLSCACCLAGGLSGCRPKRNPNVLMLVIDALRPDHLGCYGYPLATSPTIDALARRGVLFTNAASLASYTRAAVPSIFTSVHPGAHGVLTQGKKVEMLSDEYETLAETLKERGYVTAAFAPNPSLNHAFNFDQGFDLYDDNFQIGVRGAEDFETASKINERTLGWLRANPGKPFFAYLHYRDVHAPYVPPPPYDHMFDKPGDGRPLSEAEYKSQPPDVRQPRRFRDLDSYVEQYDGEIRYTDDHLARFLETLAKEGFLDDTVIFLTADHGESFLEHRSWTHGTGLYEELTRVPLLLVLPGEKHKGQRVVAPVQTTDIYPSILELLELGTLPQIQGRSLFDAIEGKADPKRPVFNEALVSHGHRPWNFGELVAVRYDGWKLIYNRRSRTAELYNLAQDPGETRDLVDSERERARDLLRMIAAQDRENAKRSHRVKGNEELPEDVVEGLKALGYVR